MDGVAPPAEMPLIAFEQAPFVPALAMVKSPKSEAFPSVDIVMYSISACCCPPAKIPRTGLEPAIFPLPVYKVLPKVAAFPCVGIVI